MAIITIPAVKSSSVTLALIRGDSSIELMNKAEVIISPPGAIWVLSFPLGPQLININNTRPWIAALVQLSKLSNTFKLTPPPYSGPSTGYSGAAPLVKDGGQLGTSINADGVTVSTAIALAGDFLEINGEFKTITADATSDGFGDVTFNFEPALRAAPADNAVIDIQTPQIELRLIDPIAAWNIKPPQIYNISINAIESFGP